MISDSLAKPISKVATKSFSHMSNSKKPSIQLIFHNHWEEFLTHPDVIKNGMRPIVPIEVEKMLSCGTIDAGFEIYECPNCHKSHIICYTCKSRFCNSCGTKQAKIRAQDLRNILWTSLTDIWSLPSMKVFVTTLKRIAHFLKLFLMP